MLIPNWRQSWRLWSVRAAALGALMTAAAAASPDALLAVWQGLPDEVRGLIPERLDRWVAPVLFMASLAVRLLKQKAPDHDQ